MTTRLGGLLAALVCAGAMSCIVIGQGLEGRSRPDAPGRTRPIRASRARMAPLPPSAWTDAQRRLVEERHVNGRVGDAFTTLLRMPDLAATIVAIEAYYEQAATLSPRHRELLVLRTSWLMNSEYL